ncbi:hypothetical protein B0H13DRAFT_2666748 [Mycena leptocephala]|nr:hypothetical protein B0H13DRAFT_2666748 [Mycena leptocephala]
MSQSYGFGFICDPPNLVKETLGIPVTTDLPDSVDLRDRYKEYYPPITNQKLSQACTAHSTGAVYQFELAKLNAGFETSKLFIYYNARLLSSSRTVAKDADAVAKDAGSNLIDVLRGMSHFGVCDERDWPDDGIQGHGGHGLPKVYPAGARGAKKPEMRIYQVAASYKTTIQNYNEDVHGQPVLRETEAWLEGHPKDTKPIAANSATPPLFTLPPATRLQAD